MRGGTTRDRATQLVKSAKHRWAYRAIDGQADIALELADRSIGHCSKEAVNPTTVKAHVGEPFLQFADIVTGNEVSEPVGEHSIAQ